MRKVVWAALCCAGVTALAGQAGAAALVDREPENAAIRSLSNILSNFNFFVELSVTGTIDVTGFGVWTHPPWPFIGQSVSLALAPDASGLPDVADLTRYSSTISEIDPRPGWSDVLAIANFSPIMLTTGIYWIGMSGADTELGWNLYTLEGVSTPSNQAVLNTAFGFLSHQCCGNSAFRVLGDGPGSVSLVPTLRPVGFVPEPSTWAMMLGGFLGLGAALRRRPVGVTA